MWTAPQAVVRPFTLLGVSDPLSPAAALVRVPGAVLSHEVAARAHSLELPDDDGRLRLTVARNRSRIRIEGWDVHRCDVPEEDLLLTKEGLRITSVPRTVVDLARALPLPKAVAVGDSALRQRLALEPDLRRVLLASRGSGSAQAHRVGRLLDPKAGSVLESVLRVVLVEAGLPAPLTQHEIRQGRRLVARVDFCWPAERLVVEADGFAFHSDRTAYRKDRERLNQLVLLGWRVLRFTWEDVMSRPEHVVGAVRRCLEVAA